MEQIRLQYQVTETILKHSAVDLISQAMEKMDKNLIEILNRKFPITQTLSEEDGTITLERDFVAMSRSFLKDTIVGSKIGQIQIEIDRLERRRDEFIRNKEFMDSSKVGAMIDGLYKAKQILST